MKVEKGSTPGELNPFVKENVFQEIVWTAFPVSRTSVHHLRLLNVTRAKITCYGGYYYIQFMCIPKEDSKHPKMYAGDDCLIHFPPETLNIALKRIPVRERHFLKDKNKIIDIDFSFRRLSKRKVFIENLNAEDMTEMSDKQKRLLRYGID